MTATRADNLRDHAKRIQQHATALLDEGQRLGDHRTSADVIEAAEFAAVALKRLADAADKLDYAMKRVA